jgi:hypothetical protein
MFSFVRSDSPTIARAFDKGRVHSLYQSTRKLQGHHVSIRVLDHLMAEIVQVGGSTRTLTQFWSIRSTFLRGIIGSSDLSGVLLVGGLADVKTKVLQN